MRKSRTDERVVTFLDTDIEGSTVLLRRIGHRYVHQLDAHRRLLRRIASDFGGSDVDVVGDSVLLVFGDPESAVRAAIIGQLALSALPQDDGEAFRVRMGIHTGPIWKRGRHYYGLTLHKVARISRLAEGGQVLLSADTASALGSSAPVRTFGRRILEGFDSPELLYEVRVVPMALSGVAGSPR